jgi:hypothetical protein
VLKEIFAKISRKKIKNIKKGIHLKCSTVFSEYAKEES